MKRKRYLIKTEGEFYLSYFKYGYYMNTKPVYYSSLKNRAYKFRDKERAQHIIEWLKIEGAKIEEETYEI